MWPESSLGVIDWEYGALGDPAYDLAVVTRGARRPFQISGGLDRLLDPYRSHGGKEVEASHVRFYELCLAVKWFRESTESAMPLEPPEVALARVVRVLSLALVH